MTHREFRDTRGISWRVWETETRREGAHGPGQHQLVFEAGRGQRRLDYVPLGWMTASPQRLEQMCRVADPVAFDESLNPEPLGPAPSPAPEASVAAIRIRSLRQLGVEPNWPTEERAAPRLHRIG